MSDAGKQILESTRKFRKYLLDIGQLLSTAGAMLEQHGYRNIAGNTACSGGSYSIESPNYWFPRNAFRFLTHEQNDHILVVISVILDDLDSLCALKQPIVTAAWFYYGEAFGNRWDYDLSRIILDFYTENMEGEMIDTPPEITRKFSPTPEILSSKTLAVPLIAIQSERNIEEKIISRLVTSLDEIIN